MKIKGTFFVTLLFAVLICRGDANVIIQFDQSIKSYFPSSSPWVFMMVNGNERVAEKKYTTSTLPSSIDLEHDTFLSTGGADKVNVYMSGASLPVFTFYGSNRFGIENRDALKGLVKTGNSTSITPENFESNGHSNFKFNYNYYYQLYYSPTKGLVLRFLKKEID